MHKTDPQDAVAELASTLRVSFANLLDAMTPEKGAAEALSLKFQPAVDFDLDSCYHVVAYDLAGNYNKGMTPYNPKGTWYCRDGERLMHSNAYVQHRCDSF